VGKTSTVKSGNRGKICAQIASAGQAMGEIMAQRFLAGAFLG
jgi:hypothetical protein